MRRHSLFFPRRYLPLPLLAVLLWGAWLASRPPTPASPPSVIEASYAGIAVTYVYDGDTIKLANGERVRLIGIDTPESSENKKLWRDAQRSGQDVRTILRLGKTAAAYTRSLLQGQMVRLEFDIQQRDKYGRLLAYVYRLEDGVFINREIIASGYAYPMTIPPNIRHADEFRRLFREAREAGRGLWADPNNLNDHYLYRG